MRWVWRAEAGAGKVEYGALLLVVSTVVVAVLAVGLPTQVSSFINESLCRVQGGENCAELYGDSRADGPKGPGTGGDQKDDAGNNEQDSGGNEANAASGYDPKAAKEYQSAEEQLEKARRQQKKASKAYGGLDKELMNELLALMGVEDARKCLTEGDLIACLKTVVGLSPWGKGFKLLKRAPKIYKLFKRWRKLKKAKEAAKGRLDKAKRRLEKARKACGAKPRSNSFLPGTLVVLADGRLEPIEDVDIGEEVLATDPASGRPVAKSVTATIRGSGVKELVDVWVLGPHGAERVTATGDHPFWDIGASAWVDADELEPGDALRSPDGTRRVVSATNDHTRRSVVYNLAVGDVDTFYVSAGDSRLLVHNEKPKKKRKTPCELNWNPNSKPTFGHTFSRHGAGSKNTEALKGRAASTGKNQGQWKNNDEGAKFIRDNYKPDGPFAPEAQVVPAPKGMGQVIKPDGTIVEASHVTIVVKPDGTIKSAYPVIK